MKRVLGVLLAGGALILLVGAAAAHWESGYGPGRGKEMGYGGGHGMGYGMMHGHGMGHGMGWGAGRGDHPGWSGTATATAPVNLEQAKVVAQKYADQYLPGFKVEKVLPFSGMHHTAYAVELKNAEGELRTFHINPFGNVMPFGGPRRSGL